MATKVVFNGLRSVQWLIFEWIVKKGIGGEKKKKIRSKKVLVKQLFIFRGKYREPFEQSLLKKKLQFYQILFLLLIQKFLSSWHNQKRKKEYGELLYESAKRNQMGYFKKKISSWIKNSKKIIIYSSD